MATARNHTKLKHTPTNPGGPQLTVAGLNVTEQTAIRMYYAGSLEEKITGYYEDRFIFEGEEVTHPDLMKLSRIERLELYNQKKKELEQYKKDIAAGKPRPDVTIAPPDDE